MAVTKQSRHTTIRGQLQQLHSRAELIRVQVDVPLRRLNAGVTSQGSQQARVASRVMKERLPEWLLAPASPHSACMSRKSWQLVLGTALGETTMKLELLNQRLPRSSAVHRLHGNTAPWSEWMSAP